MKKKKNNKVVEDDNRTISNMNVEGFRWYRKGDPNERVKLTKKERHAAFKGALLAYLPMLAVILISFGIMYVILKLWLK